MQFQTGDYCIIVWDDKAVSLEDALTSLEQCAAGKGASKVVFAADPQITSESCISKANRVTLAASLIRPQITYEGKTSDNVLRQICDTAQELTNLAYALGFSNMEISGMLADINKED